jgi:hypothetical protein
MLKFALLFSLILSPGYSPGLSKIEFKVDGKSIVYSAPLEYSVLTDPVSVSQVPSQSPDGEHSPFYHEIGSFYPFHQVEDVRTGRYDKYSSCFTLYTPRDPSERVYKMPREQFIIECQKYVRTVIYGDQRTTYYGDRQVAEDFKRPTPFILGDSSDQYGIYDQDSYSYQYDGKEVKVQQVDATTLVKGIVFHVIYLVRNPRSGDEPFILNTARENIKKFVESNSAG